MQNGTAVHMMLSAWHHWLYNLKYLLFQEKDNTYENRRALDNYQKPQKWFNFQLSPENPEATGHTPTRALKV